MPAPIILCVMGGVFLCGTPVPAEASPSETPAAVPSEEAQEQVQLKRPLRPLRTLLERALSESASDAGTSETIFRSRIQVRYEHRDRRDDAVEDKIVFRIDRPLFDDRLYFRVDVP